MWPALGLGMLLQGTTSLFAANQQADAEMAQASYNRLTGEFNAKLAEMDAEDALAMGESAVMDVEKEGRRIRGAQRSSLAAQGVDADKGSAAGVATDTFAEIAKDKMTLRNNAWRQAWGFKVEAHKHRTAAAFGYAAGSNVAGSTLLTGGAKALGGLATGIGRLSDYWGEKSAPSDPSSGWGMSGGLA